ncbi:MAG: rRNA pseudouridine synthase [Deltaproteobacteria bacterium]|nr:rRNA pseudouridine synthase [Deltaproteobacteria bacterium]
MLPRVPRDQRWESKPRRHKPPTIPPPSPPPALERLQKILSRAGIVSRRKAEELILGGQVRVNGRVVTELGTKANPQTDRITVNGRPLPQPRQPIYILLHKPVGIVTTLDDPEGRPTVRDVIPSIRTRVYPVGRLDYASSGLLLLTNDGDLALRATHPRYGLRKTYHVKVKGVPRPETLERMAAGVRLDDGKSSGTAEIRLLRASDDKAWIEISLSEGRNREVRRICETLGHPVEKLGRVALGPLKLGKLQPGESRPLTARELRDLRVAVGLEPRIFRKNLN